MEKPKIIIPEIQETLQEISEVKKDIENLSQDGVAVLRQGLELVDDCLAQIEHMKSNNEFLDDAEEEGLPTGSVKRYSEFEIIEAQQYVDYLKKEISEIHKGLNQLSGFDMQLNEKTEKLQELEEKAKNMLLRQKPESLN